MKIVISYFVTGAMFMVLILHIAARANGWPDVQIHTWTLNLLMLSAGVTLLGWMGAGKLIDGLVCLLFACVPFLGGLAAVEHPVLGMVGALVYTIAFFALEYWVAAGVQNPPNSAPIGVRHPSGSICTVHTAGRTHREVMREARSIRQGYVSEEEDE